MTPQSASRTRRQVCLGALVCGLASAAFAAPPPSAPAALNGNALVAAGVGPWTRLIGTGFSVQGENGATSFRLTKVEPLTGAARARKVGRPESFILYFDAPAGQTAVKGDNTYRFYNPGTGTFELMVGARYATRAFTRYVAIMN